MSVVVIVLLTGSLLWRRQCSVGLLKGDQPHC